MKKCIDFLQSKLKANDTVILACSAGPDSMALFDMLQKLNIDINIICAHVNHNVRKQSKKEYSYLENYCKERNIVFEGMEIVYKLDKNFESEARKIRYDFFKVLKNKYNAKCIITAHHGDDLVETILMRLTRGSNLSGYIGIKEEDKDYLRPLLFITKSEIKAYLKKNNIYYFNDKTNNQDKHTRNRYRHYILPFLKKENINIHTKYKQFSDELNEYNIFLTNYIIKNNLINDNEISITKIKNEEDLVQKKCVELLIKKIQEEYQLDISNKNLKDIIDLINSPKSNGIINLNNNFVAEKNYNMLTIHQQTKLHTVNEIYNGYYENDCWIIKDSNKCNQNTNFVIRIYSKEVTLPLKIRNKQENDVMEVKNLGHKKIKSIFIDSKIKPSERSTWPMLVDSNDNIIWIPGIKKSKFDKDKNEKYDIIITSERKK